MRSTLRRLAARFEGGHGVAVPDDANPACSTASVTTAFQSASGRSAGPAKTSSQSGDVTLPTEAAPAFPMPVQGHQGGIVEMRPFVHGQEVEAHVLDFGGTDHLTLPSCLCWPVRAREPGERDATGGRRSCPGHGHGVLAGPLVAPAVLRDRPGDQGPCGSDVDGVGDRIRGRSARPGGPWSRRGASPSAGCPACRPRDLDGARAVEAAFDGSDLLGAGGCHGGDRKGGEPRAARLICEAHRVAFGGWQAPRPVRRTGDPVPSLTRRCEGSSLTTAGCRKMLHCNKSWVGRSDRGDEFWYGRSPCAASLASGFEERE